MLFLIFLDSPNTRISKALHGVHLITFPSVSSLPSLLLPAPFNFYVFYEEQNNEQRFLFVLVGRRKAGVICRWYYANHSLSQLP